MEVVKDIRTRLIDQYNSSNFIKDRTIMPIIELINTSFIADEPSIFGKPNYEYIERELEWYKSQSLSVNDIPGKTPQIWTKSADRDGNINSNYGWCIWSEKNGYQYDNTLNELKKNQHSRRAQMTYTRPSIWLDYNENGKNDYICTNTTNHFIRNNKLIYIVYMRSNDAIFGYSNDLAWHEYVFEILYNDLRLEYHNLEKDDNIIWNATSLQVYQRHFNLISEWNLSQIMY